MNSYLSAFGLSHAPCLMLLVACLMPLLGCSYAGIRIDSPLAQQMGVSVHGYSMSVSNNTPLYGKVVIYDKEIGVLGAGDVFHDKRHWEPLSPEIPVLVLFYIDSGTKHYVGAAARTLRIGGYQNTASWTISRGDVQMLDGPYPEDLERETSMQSVRVPFPREPWNATSAMQIVNNTLASCTVRVNGVNRITLQTGDVWMASARNIGFYGTELDIQLVFTKAGNLAGMASRQVFVPANGIWSFQWIVDESDINNR